MRPSLTCCLLVIACCLTLQARPGAAQELGATATAATTIDGLVRSSHARWSGSQIVTESVVVTAGGREVTVLQAGGTVDGVGMIQIPGQVVLAAGDRVSLRVQALPEAAAARAQWVDEVASLARDGAITKGVHDELPQEMPYVRTTNDFDTPLSWSSGCIYITYDSAGTSHLAGDEEFAIMDQVLRTWEAAAQATSYLVFADDGREALEVGLDAKNVIKFRDDRWCRPAAGDDPERCYSQDAAALTTLYYVNDADSARNGEILDGDIEFNGVNFAISAGGQSQGTAACLADLANTLTHEVGHLIGLEHTCRGPAEPQRLDNAGTPVPSCSTGQLPPAITEATMYNYQECGETKKITPEADDIAGFSGIYPRAADPGECERAKITTKRGCSLAGDAGTGGAAAQVLLICLGALLAGRRRRRA